MAKAYVVTGTLSNGRVVELDEPVPLSDAKVRVSIEPLLSVTARPIGDVIGEIRIRQAAGGYVPRTREAVDRYLADERESWDT